MVARVKRPLRIGKMYMESGVVRSVNHNAPPSWNEGTFSAIFRIYIEKQSLVRFMSTGHLAQTTTNKFMVGVSHLII